LCIIVVKLRIAGHSLGGAIATHATAHLIKAGHKVDVSYTFGSPRVGNHDFSVWYYNLNDKLLRPRVTHGQDPVPHLPPEAFGFQHVRT
jgi:predicted lipase